MIAEPQMLLIGAVAAVGVLHTIVPDHWVPITIIARQQGWSKREVARAALVAGTGHTVSTLLIGLVVWFAGIAVATTFGNLVSTISSIALIAFGGWIVLSSLRALRTENHGHAHRHGHAQGHALKGDPHGPELVRIPTDFDVLELSIMETGQPPHFRLSGHSGDRVWLETVRESGESQLFRFENRGKYWESLNEIPEPHEFVVTVSVAHGDHVHSYDTAFTEHEHAHSSDANDGENLYVPSQAGTAVLTKHVHAHRHGRTAVHVHLHDHGPDTWHRDIAENAGDPPLHTHKHRRSLRTMLLLILGSSPMVEGIPAFFAASKYGAGLLAVMAVVFAAFTISTYVLLCVASVAGLQRISLGPLERYGEVLSGAFIAAVGMVFLIFPVL
jgi:hypothetical protein